MDSIIKSVVARIDESSGLIASCRNQAPALTEAALTIARALARGRQLLTFGNGGSAAQAQHIAAEMVGRFLKERKPLRAVALNTDTSILTAVGNDYGYQEVFTRQITALAQPGDVVLALSTSGSSANVLAALEAARALGAQTILLCGSKAVPPEAAAQIIGVSRQAITPHVQEAHLVYAHIICGLIDYFLFDDPQKISGSVCV